MKIIRTTAGEGLLLDRANPKWRIRYFAEKFDNEKYFQRGTGNAVVVR